jgi:hypothetical protein
MFLEHNKAFDLLLQVSSQMREKNKRKKKHRTKKENDTKNKENCIENQNQPCRLFEACVLHLNPRPEHCII